MKQYQIITMGKNDKVIIQNGVAVGSSAIRWVDSRLSLEEQHYIQLLMGI